MTQPAILKARRLANALWFARTARLIRRSGAFDEGWYRAFYPESAGWDVIVHYLAIGAAKGYRPHVLFDPQWWREQRGHSRHANVFVDYLRAPERWSVPTSPYLVIVPAPEETRQSRDASPLSLYRASEGRDGLAATSLFDADFYARHNPDVVAAGIDPLLHFISNGGREGRSPCASFDAFWYLSVNPDVKARGDEPLRHFLMRGARQGRAPHRAIDPAIMLALAPATDIINALSHYQSEGRRRLDAHSHDRLPPPGALAPLLDDWPWLKPVPVTARGRQIIVLAGQASANRTETLQALVASPTGPQPWLVALDTAAIEMLAGIDAPTLCFEEPSEALLRALFRAVAFAGPHLTVAIDAPPGHPAHACAAASGLQPASLPDHGAGLVSPVPATPLQVSVVVPSYNHAAFLDQRLATILAQSRRPCEIIIIDDASQDDSLTRAHAFADTAPLPVSVIAHEHNSGSPFAAWAEGARLARGELLWIAESDDLAHPRLLERLAPFLERDPETVFAYSQSAAIGAHGERLADEHLFYTDDIDPHRWEAPYQVAGQDEIAAALAIKNTIPNVSAVLFRREPFAAAVDESLADRYCGDWRLYARLAAQGRIGYSPEPLNQTRRHHDNATMEGERGMVAIREAETIRLALWQQPYVPAATIRAGYAQHAREIETRRERHALPIAPFEDEPAFRPFRDAVAALLRKREKA